MDLVDAMTTALLTAPALMLLAGCSGKLNGGSHAGHDVPAAQAATIDAVQIYVGYGFGYYIPFDMMLLCRLGIMPKW